MSPSTPPDRLEDASGRVFWELLDDPAVRLGLVASVVLTIVLALLLGTALAPWPFALIAGVGLLLAIGSLLRPVPTPLRRRGVTDKALWSVSISVVGPVLTGALVTVAVDVPVQPFAGLFALLLLLAAVLPPSAARVPLLSWQVAVWMAVLLLAGERDPLVLLLHLGGAVALCVLLVRTARALSVDYAEAVRARAGAEQRAELLASLLRTHDLDPSVVLRSVADGLIGLGFDVASIREIDRGAGLARIVEGVARGELTVEEELSLNAPEFELLERTAAPVVLEQGAGGAASLTDLGLQSALLFPVLDGEEVVAVVSAGVVAHRPAPEAVDAAELLVEQAGVALRRARAYREDQATTAELQRLEQRTQDFISTVSHELRTPLTVVQGLGATLEERWAELDADRREDLLRRIDANADRLATMVTRLLDTSQLSRGGLRVVATDVALAPWLHGALDRLGEVLSDHTVEVDVDPDLRVAVDQDLFEHVTDNLLVNLARHTPAGTAARLRAELAGDRVVVVLEDDGPGIDEQDLPHVLERFYRGGDTSHRVHTRGLGLGLALAAEVVRAHGGQLTAATGDSGGAAFRFDVPRATHR